MVPKSFALKFTGICKLFEQKLKHENPTARNITYDISDLYGYIDNLNDLGALVYVDETQINLLVLTTK
jgi:hypothetical protein